MKKIFFSLLALAICFGGQAQRLSKQEQEAKDKAEYEVALECINAKNFVIVPSSFNEAGNDVPNTDNAVFFACENGTLFIQGKGITGTGNDDPNLAEISDWDLKIGKKGEITLRFNLLGRRIKANVKISMNNKGNIADVIYTPQPGSARRFQGPLVAPGQANYYKKSNPM